MNIIDSMSCAQAMLPAARGQLKPVCRHQAWQEVWVDSACTALSGWSAGAEWIW